METFLQLNSYKERIQFSIENKKLEGFSVNGLGIILSYNDWSNLKPALDIYSLSFEDRVWPLLIIDNSSTDEVYSCFSREDFFFPWRFVKLTSNIGVASAYNLALELAENIGVQWLLLLDQDSHPKPGMTSFLLRAGEEILTKGNKLGAVAPAVHSRKFPEIAHLPYLWNKGDFASSDLEKKLSKKIPLPIDSTLTSGTLYNLDALREVKGFRDDYFIDFVDHECHLRMRKAGWEIYWVPWAELEHNLGAWQEKTENGIWIEHLPYRYYYMARNMLAMYWRFGGFKGVFKAARQIYRHCGLLSRFGREPGKCKAYILKGVLDALKGSFGPLDAKD